MWGLLHEPSSRFIAQLVVTIGLARLLARVARKLGQPAVVAEIIAGILLGPSVLRALLPSVSVALFPSGSLDPVRSASELGLVLFAFVIGLELDATQLRGRTRNALTIAVASVVVPFVLGCATAAPVSRLVSGTAPSLQLALFMGAAMSVTAFPVLARILAERRLLRSPLGALAIACAALSDVVGWCVLAFLVAAARASGFADALATTLFSAVFVGAMWFVVRPLLVRLVERSNAPVTVSPDITVLLVVGALGSAWITHVIGAHLVFGAFAFGALVPKRDGFARAVAEKLEDVVVVVLMPLFFVMSGLRTEIQIMGSARDVLACGLIVVVACVGKLGTTTLVARLTGHSWREAGALGVLMNTRGLVELILLNIGFELGVLSPALFSMMVVMVLVTTMVTGPALARIYPVRDAIRELVATNAGPERTAEGQVMICISHPRVGPAMVRIARWVGGSDAGLLALHLTRDEGETAEPPDGSAVLGPALAAADALDVPVRPLSFSSPEPAQDIVRVADVRAPEVVVLGYHKPVLSQTLLGGVVHDVLRDVAAVVAVAVDRDLPDHPASLLLPFHGTPHDRAALRLAARIQRKTGAALTVLSVDAAGDGDAEARLAATQAGASATFETVRDRDSAAAVLARARSFDLVIVGVGREWGTNAKRIGFGFGAERLIRDCPSSLLIVRERLGDLARAKVEA